MSALYYIFIMISGRVINYITAETQKDPHRPKPSRQNSILTNVIASVIKHMGQHTREDVKCEFDNSQ